MMVGYCVSVSCPMRSSLFFFFFFSSRRRHTRFDCDWSSDVCSSDWIVANGIDDDSAPHAIAAGDLSRKTGKRHERVHEVRVTLTPQPCVHAAHRCAHHEPEVCHTEALGQQSILSLDHVEVSVARKGGAKAVARLAGS